MGADDPLIERTPPRALFAQLVAGALEITRVEPTPMATAYLVELLQARVRVPAARPSAEGGEPSLAEALLEALRLRGMERIRRLRSLGDRALFTRGFFGDSLGRRGLGAAYYGDAGRLAYAELSTALAARRAERTWRELFEELADRFPEFADVLTEVGDRARSPGALLRLYERYLRSGSEHDRRRLMRRGHAVPAVEGPWREQ